MKKKIFFNSSTAHHPGKILVLFSLGQYKFNPAVIYEQKRADEMQMALKLPLHTIPSQRSPAWQKRANETQKESNYNFLLVQQHVVCKNPSNQKSTTLHHQI